MSSTPRVRSTAVVSRPTGPAPVTSTRSSGATSARFTVWIAIAVGSVSAAARLDSASGIRDSRRRGDGDVAAERAAELEEVGWLPAQADRRTARAGRPGTRRNRVSGSSTTRVPISQSAAAAAERPRRSRTTRGRAPSPAGRTARARGGGRCRRCRSARPRRAHRLVQRGHRAARAPRWRRHRGRRPRASRQGARGGTYSAWLNCTIAPPRASRATSTTMPSSSATGRWKLPHVMPGLSRRFTPGGTWTWENTARRMGSTA